MSPARLLTVLLLLNLALAAPAQAQNVVNNGDFEAGLSGWTTWTAPASSFWDATWIQSNDCDIWVPTNGCPFAGALSHAQKKGNGAGNAHGGLFQVLTVQPGQTYDVSGQWSGGVTGNVDSNNGSWWEVVVYEGVVDDTIIDAGLRPGDTLIAKVESNNLANGAVFQFQWQAFSGSFTAQSSSVTLALKAGSFFTYEAAAYHDDLVVQAQAPTPPPASSSIPVPVDSPVALALLALLLGFTGLRVAMPHRPGSPGRAGTFRTGPACRR